MKKVRTIIIDGIEIQTSLSAVEIADLVQKNQELKKQLEDLQETHYLIQGGRSNGKTYLMKLQADKEQLNSLVNSCQEEIRQLKKQAEEINKMIEKCGFVNIEQVMLNYCGLLAQQKEFIEYLEYKLCIANKVLDEQEEDEEVRGYVLARKFILEEILSKYQEIIGKDINVTTKGDKDDK